MGLTTEAGLLDNLWMRPASLMCMPRSISSAGSYAAMGRGGGGATTASKPAMIDGRAVLASTGSVGSAGLRIGAKRTHASCSRALQCQHMTGTNSASLPPPTSLPAFASAPTFAHVHVCKCLCMCTFAPLSVSVSVCLSLRTKRWPDKLAAKPLPSFHPHKPYLVLRGHPMLL